MVKNLSLSIATFCLVLSGCGQNAETKVLNVSALNGPTGIAMAKMINDEDEDYDITVYQSPDEVTGKIINGEIDIASVPSNVAAVLYNKTDKNIELLGVNTWGVLYIVENGNTVNSFEDLKGKKIITSGKGSSPEYVLDKLLEEYRIKDDVEVEYLANHTDVVAKLAAEDNVIALLPQPHVGIALSKNSNAKIAIDVNKVWKEKTGEELPMGVLVARKEVVDNNKTEVEEFLKDYKESADFVGAEPDEIAKLVADAGIIANEQMAAKVISACGIKYESAEEAKEAVDKYYETLFEMNPKAIGGTMVDEAFYYIN